MNPTKQGLKQNQVRDAVTKLFDVLAHESNKTRIETEDQPN